VFGRGGLLGRIWGIVFAVFLLLVPSGPLWLDMIAI
jgi:hypothetical protein